MLTLQETLTSQHNLSQLCADRALRTREIFRANAFYGSDAILKRYVGLPQTYSLKAVVPHGVVRSETHIWEAEQAARLPVIFCYPPYRERTYVSQTGKSVVLSASPFVYVVELLKDQPKPARCGTIFFPGHSTHHVTAQMDFERLAEGLTHLGDEYKPITVCVYWRDFNLEHHIPFQKREMRIVSAGHMYDPDFLFRFYHLCSTHRYSASNSLGSSLFCSVKSGCSYFQFDTVGYSLVADKVILKRDVAPPSPAMDSALKSLFREPQADMTTEQLRTVDYYLGADHLKSPQGLRRQLLYAEILDKVGLLVRNRGEATKFVTPAYLRRGGQAWKRRLLGIGSRLLRSWKGSARGLRPE